MSRQGWQLPTMLLTAAALLACQSSGSYPAWSAPAEPRVSNQALALPVRLPAVVAHPVPPDPIRQSPLAPARPSPLEDSVVPSEPVQLVQYAEHEDEVDREMVPPSARDAEDLPRPPSASADAHEHLEPLQLGDVIASVRTSYPLLLAAQREQQVQQGKLLSASGAFDLHLYGYGISEPLGFFQSTRSQLVLTQPLEQGGYIFGAYKIGDGKFAPWYKERETNDGGEFSAGWGLPLLKDRAIDKRRGEIAQSSLAAAAVDPAVRAQLLEFVRIASQQYWEWVAAGQTLETFEDLLRLAERRAAQLDERVERGDLERIAQLNNRQLIAARETRVIEARRKLEASAIKLSLFVRTADGLPVIPHASLRPTQFPTPARLAPERVSQDIQLALQARPEFAELDFLARQVRVELAQAENQLLPKLDALVETSKDVGGWADATGNKTPLELQAGLYGEMPIQRREARGKVESARGKLAQIMVKREFLANKVTAQVQDAVSALVAADGRIERAEVNVDLAVRTLELGQISFDAGDIDLVSLNIYEQAVADAQLILIAARADFFAALADYYAALGSDDLAE